MPTTASPHTGTHRQINSTQTWHGFILQVTKDSWRFVIILCVCRASRLLSPGLCLQFPAVSLSEDQSLVKYAGILLDCSACHGISCVYQLSTKPLTDRQSMQIYTHMRTYAV